MVAGLEGRERSGIGAIYRLPNSSHRVGTIAPMGQIYVEGWAPDYGSPMQTDVALAEPEKVDEDVEVAGRWLPIDGVDDGIAEVVFVDGVRRVDARLTLDDPADGPIAGLCGTYAVGAVAWDRRAGRSSYLASRVERLALFGSGKAASMPVAGPRLVYRSEAVAETDPGALVQRFHGAMRKAEAVLSEELVRGGRFVVADGPINDLSATEKVGFVKSHRAPYLSADRRGVVGRLAAGQRTPLFLIGAGGAYPRYSWYFRLAEVPRGHAWSGIARAEVSSHLDLATARRVADRVAAVLPATASQPHIDPRAPQNLVPIAALERELRRLMGDPAFVYRALREATMRDSIGSRR